MHTILGIFLLLARNPFPADYQPSPCATPEAIARVGKSFPQSQVHQIAEMRGYDVPQEWVDAHWKELSADLAPIWAQATTCFVTAANDNLFCNDIAVNQAFATCNKHPKGSKDREYCIFAMTAILAGQDR